MNFLKSVSCLLLALAIGSTLQLAEIQPDQLLTHKANAFIETGDQITCESLLPTASFQYSSGYKISGAGLKSPGIQYISVPGIPYRKSFHSIFSGIPGHALLLIYSFHSFW